MREIKFRSWDKERNRMTETPFNIGGTGRICGVAFFENDLIPVEIIANESKRYVVMQYTGLKDKNGVDIYEGDIVKISDWVTNDGKHFYDDIGTVTFKKGMFLLLNDYFTETALLKTEVIGNIYENSDLLK